MSRPVYKIPVHLLEGVEGKEFIVNNWNDEEGVERAGATALVYHRWLPDETCSDVVVEEWLKRRRSGEEERVLIAEEQVSRGWECSHVLIVDFRDDARMENLVMRTVGYCAVVR